MEAGKYFMTMEEMENYAQMVDAEFAANRQNTPPPPSSAFDHLLAFQRSQRSRSDERRDGSERSFSDTHVRSWDKQESSSSEECGIDYSYSLSGEQRYYSERGHEERYSYSLSGEQRYYSERGHEERSRSTLGDVDERHRDKQYRDTSYEREFSSEGSLERRLPRESCAPNNGHENRHTSRKRHAQQHDVTPYAEKTGSSAEKQATYMKRTSKSKIRGRDNETQTEEIFTASRGTSTITRHFMEHATTQTEAPRGREWTSQDWEWIQLYSPKFIRELVRRDHMEATRVKKDREESKKYHSRKYHALCN